MLAHQQSADFPLPGAAKLMSKAFQYLWRQEKMHSVSKIAEVFGPTPLPLPAGLSLPLLVRPQAGRHLSGKSQTDTRKSNPSLTRLDKRSSGMRKGHAELGDRLPFWPRETL